MEKRIISQELNLKDVKSYWIWNYGDHEIFHSNQLNSRREQCGADYPCFWRLFDVDRNVKFYCEFEAKKDGVCTLFVNGFAILAENNRTNSANTLFELTL